MEKQLIEKARTILTKHCENRVYWHSNATIQEFVRNELQKPETRERIVQSTLDKMTPTQIENMVERYEALPKFLETLFKERK